MLTVQIVNGLMEGMMIYLVASGLTLIFGVSGILNFAHGSFYMLGAFLTYVLVPHLFPDTLGGLLLSVFLASLSVALLGTLFEMHILRRVYGSDPLLQLIVTMALVLIIRDVVLLIWGRNDLTVSMPSQLTGALQIGDVFFPVFQLVIFAVGLAIITTMIFVIHFTRAGILLRAATDDRGMVALLGINQSLIFTGVFAAGSFLAGIAGGLTAPFGSINYLLDTTVIVITFIVVVIGGLGNLYGALAAALIFGVLKGVSLIYFPRLSMILIFLIMASVLVYRSFGRQDIGK